MGPYALNVFRVGVSTLLFWLVWIFGKTKAGIEKKDVGRFVLCAICGIVLNQTLFIKGLTLTLAIHASLLMLVTPLLVSFFALWILKERFTIRKAFGLLLGIAGAVFLVLQKESSQHASNYLSGDLLLLLNATFYAFYLISVKPLMEKYSPLHVIRWVFTISLPVILPIGWKEIENIHWAAFDLNYSMVLAAIVITGSFLAYYFTGYGLQHLSPSVTGSYIYTQPVFAVLIAVLFLNEPFTWQKGISALLIFAGVYLVSLRRKRSRRPLFDL